MKGHRRFLFVKWGGVKLTGSEYYIGRNVIFDTLCPERIRIDDNVHITSGCVLLTHYLDTSYCGIKWEYGDIHICKNAFIGMNTIICKPCTIGEGAIVGAGSVVTKDIPANEIWGGNPAKFIKKRN